MAFAAHAVILTILTISMFSGGLWGFEQRKGQRLSRAVLGTGIGCVVGVVCIIAVVLIKRDGGGRDPNNWAWIDVVGTLHRLMDYFDYHGSEGLQFADH